MSDLHGYHVPFGKTHIVGWHALDVDYKYPVPICNTASVQRADAVFPLYPPFAHPDASGMCRNCLRIAGFQWEADDE